MSDENVIETEATVTENTEVTGLKAALKAEREKRQALESDSHVQAAMIAREAGFSAEEIVTQAYQREFGGGSEGEVATPASTESPQVLQAIAEIRAENARLKNALDYKITTDQEKEVERTIDRFAASNPDIKPGSPEWEAIGAMAYAKNITLEEAKEKVRALKEDTYNKGLGEGEAASRRKKDAATEGKGSAVKEADDGPADTWADLEKRIQKRLGG